MIALACSILAHYCMDDPGDLEAAMNRSIDQAIQARPLRPFLIIPLTVILELESLLRAFYRIDAVKIVQVLEHLLAWRTSTSRNPSNSLRLSFSLLAHGADFSDALHLLGCSDCETLYTFNDRRFTRRAQHLAGSRPSLYRRLSTR